MRIVGRRWSVVVLIDFVLLFALGLPVYGRHPEHIPQIGFIAFGSAPSYAERVAAFRSGLQQLGYIVGKNIQVVYRYTEKFGPIVADIMKRNSQVKRWASGCKLSTSKSPPTSKMRFRNPIENMPRR